MILPHGSTRRRAQSREFSRSRASCLRYPAINRCHTCVSHFFYTRYGAFDQYVRAESAGNDSEDGEGTTTASIMRIGMETSASPSPGIHGSKEFERRSWFVTADWWASCPAPTPGRPGPLVLRFGVPFGTEAACREEYHRVGSCIGPLAANTSLPTWAGEFPFSEWCYSQSVQSRLPEVQATAHDRAPHPCVPRVCQP